MAAANTGMRPKSIASAKRTHLTSRIPCGVGEKVRLADIAFRQRMNSTVGMIDNKPTTANAPSFAQKEQIDGLVGPALGREDCPRKSDQDNGSGEDHHPH